MKITIHKLVHLVFQHFFNLFQVFKQPRNANHVWTDADLARLAKMMKKFPAGNPERWEKIAEAMERLPTEVTKMAGKVKSVAYQVRKNQRRVCVDTTEFEINLRIT